MHNSNVSPSELKCSQNSNPHAGRQLSSLKKRKPNQRASLKCRTCRTLARTLSYRAKPDPLHPPSSPI
uniref:Uncharacterized protein n=1 Tax=Anguilla anguilla TaxID=7936 RepID=A0A0E9SAD3_ANGAN